MDHFQSSNFLTAIDTVYGITFYMKKLKNTLATTWQQCDRECNWEIGSIMSEAAGYYTLVEIREQH